ncbi:MAG: DNA polymerase IV [Clostridiales bacterium]|nr:DNA polymerase IV [Clostridiales bacterium]
MARVILHADANGFYASVELVYRPELRGLPLSVGGDQEARHGIVLASSREAKRWGIKTGMVLWQARQLCPDLIVLSPNFSRYIAFSRQLRKIYEEYSPRVESYGLDECWIDISNLGVSLEDGKDLADELRRRVREELGITLSVGVSWNKIFAKLGSDYKKPDATTLISPENYQDIVWPLPAGDLLFVGPRTRPKLAKYRIYTVGDIANAPDEFLSQRFGKVGRMHQCHARGMDESPVMAVGTEAAIKSVGNSTTAPQDMCSIDDVRCVYTLLAESVATRLREAGLKGRCISISVRDAELNCEACQLSIDHHTALAGEIRDVAMQLFTSRSYERMLPLRSVGVSCSSLTSFYAPLQMDLMGKAASWERQLELAKSVDQIRRRYGTQIIQRGNVLAKPAFSSINPHDDHVIHPVPFYAG